jgi:iron complex outermembrane receptor protein
MIGLKILRSALIGGASVLTLVSPSAAKVFNIPDGDLAAALNIYIRQSGVQLVYMDDAVRGHRSHGAKGDYTETAALTQILSGTGFTAQTMPSSAIGIVPQQRPKLQPVEQLAQAARPASAAPAAPAGIETVVVTAQKKSENIQTVPISVTALSQSDLTNRQIAAGPDLLRDVPNMNFSKTNFSGYSIELRGIGTQAISVTTDPAVAVAYNGIPFLRNHFFEQEFFDLDNVEVLRGPQGTLYGRNATAGVVNLIPALPTDTFEGMVSADVGNYMERRLEGMINLPIVSDELDIRVAGEWTKRSGYTLDTTLNTDVDGRDLWSGRVSIGFKPTSDLQTYLVWEHFSEDDDRLRSGKQLCETNNPPASVSGSAPTPGGGTYNISAVVPGIGYDLAYGGAYDPAGYLSQGCQAASLYSPDSFEVPDGYSLQYVKAAKLYGGIIDTLDPYAEATQSSNLRSIESILLPHYRAKNDIVEFNADYKLTPELTLTSQTGWNNDYLFSTEDYNRFDTTPGIFDPNVIPNGIFCDPQLGCSNRLVGEDLSDETAWQFSQELRLASNFSGPFNFSFGANYLHYVTEENYYVFINALTIYAVYGNIGGCQFADGYGFQPLNPATHTSDPEQNQCALGDPNPIGSLNNQGHDYFLSQNPYALSSYAVFGETYYDILDDLKLTTGLRFTDDQKSFTDIPSEVLTDGLGYYETGVVNQSWDRLTGRAVLDWTPKLDFTDQTLVYASYAHGYKAGGANPPGAALIGNGIGEVGLPDHPLTFKPEYIEAFEFGTKNTLLDGSLTLNGDIFYYNYTGYQISEIVDRTAINNNYNAHVEGAEIESNWEPLPGLKFNFAGGWEDTVAAGGDSGVDLIDRTAGNPNWIVVKPYPTQASNCILPTYVVAAILSQDIQGNNTGNPGALTLVTACDAAYNANVDPVTQLPYVPNPTAKATNGVLPPGYPGFNPATAPNNGEGFSKNLAGHALPNAPPFTVSLGSQYTIPVLDDWAATLRGDFYWQADSWARIFNDNPYDRIDGYTNVNFALIFSSDDGWQIMAYVKNAFNVTAITGDFLNSDDSGLTTNVFLTDPRLYGVRVTKNFGEGDTGAMGNVENWIAGLFADADRSKPALWFTFGGELAQQTGQGEPFVPPFVSGFPNSKAYQPQSPTQTESPQTYTYDQEAKITFQPEGSDWQFVASVQYGRASRNRYAQDEGKGGRYKHEFCCNQTITYFIESHVEFSTTQAKEAQTHAIVDFELGKDVGIGLFGPDETSTVDAGARVVQFASSSSSTIHAMPEWAQHTVSIPNYFLGHLTQFHSFGGYASAKRSFKGIGPTISWNDSVPVMGNPDAAQFTVDWGANAAMLFGRRKVAGSHSTVGRYKGYKYSSPDIRQQYSNAPAPFHRDKEVMVPNLGGFAGMSVNFRNAKVSFGYRGDFFFSAMDTGWDQSRVRTIGLFGPFANLSIGF